MEGFSDEQWTQWKKKRHHTFVSFILVGIVVGIDYSVIFTTLFLYLRDTIKTDHSEVYYGLIIALFQISSAIFGLFGGRWLDKTRRVKRFSNILIFLQIVGSILYLVPYHVCFPILGRLIAGTGDPFISVCSGEVVRVYSEEEGTRALWWLAACYSFGMVAGPVIPLAFAGIDFKLGPIAVTQYNFIGLFMACLFVAVWVITYLLMHDCSKEFDLKEHEQARSSDAISSSYPRDISLSRTQDTVIPPSTFLTIRKLCTNFDVVLLFISTFVCMYAMFSVDELMPLIFVVVLEWKLAALGGFFMVSGLIYAILLFLMSKYCISNISLYITMVVCLIGSVLMYITIAIIKIKDRSLAADWILVVLLGFFWLLTTCMEEVLIRAILARKVESSVQSFTEGLRHSIARVAATVAALTTPLLLPVIGRWGIFMACIMGLLTAIYAFRKNSLVSAKVIALENPIKELDGENTVE